MNPSFDSSSQQQKLGLTYDQVVKFSSMNRYWKKTVDNSFAFYADGKEIGTIDFYFGQSTKAAEFRIGSETFTISRKGFWNSTLLIKDAAGLTVLQVTAEKWYAHQWVLQYADKTYALKVRNHPLAEYVIIDGDTEILAYGLKVIDGNVQVAITCAASNPPYLFDALLWFLFAPLAIENLGDEISFTLLLAQ